MERMWFVPVPPFVVAQLQCPGLCTRTAPEFSHRTEILHVDRFICVWKFVSRSFVSRVPTVYTGIDALHRLVYYLLMQFFVLVIFHRNGQVCLQHIGLCPVYHLFTMMYLFIGQGHATSVAKEIRLLKHHRPLHGFPQMPDLCDAVM